MKVPVHSILPAPGTPSFLAFSEITSTTLNVSWGEPLAANGILQGYRVVYEPLAPVQGKARGEQGEGQLTGAQSPTVHRVSRVSPWRARRLAGWGPGEQRPSQDQSLCFLGSSTALSTGLCVMSLDLVSLIPKPFSPFLLRLQCSWAPVETTVCATCWNHRGQHWPVRHHRHPGKGAGSSPCSDISLVLPFIHSFTQ